MNKKEIIFLRSVLKVGIEFSCRTRYTVNLLHVGIAGGLSSIPSAGVMDGELLPIAIVEFENGKIISLVVDRDIHIVGNAE